eukprot:UN01939
MMSSFKRFIIIIIMNQSFFYFPFESFNSKKTPFLSFLLKFSTFPFFPISTLLTQTRDMLTIIIDRQIICLVALFILFCHFNVSTFFYYF